MTDEEIKQEFDKISKNEYSAEDINATLEKEEYVDSLSSKGPLAKNHDDLKTLYGMLKNKDKFKLSKSSLAIIVGALVYVISPIDLVPDVIPVLGLLDDAAIIAAAVKALHDEIKRYNEWKNIGK